MKLLIALFVLLFSVSVYAQHPAAIHTPDGHCRYSVYGCSGAGGSTDYYGRSYGYHGHPGYRPPVYGHRPGYPVYGNPCGGNYVNRYGNVGSYNGHVNGNLGFSRGTSAGGCGNGHSSSQTHGNIGYYNGQVTGNLGFFNSQSN